MKLSYGFRRDLEHQLVELCGKINENLLSNGVITDIENARDRLQLLSKNNPKQFNDFLLAARGFYIQASAFSWYLEELKFAIQNRKYSFKHEKYYSTIHGEVKEVE